MTMTLISNSTTGSTKGRDRLASRILTGTAALSVAVGCGFGARGDTPGLQNDGDPSATLPDPNDPLEQTPSSIADPGPSPENPDDPEFPENIDDPTPGEPDPTDPDEPEVLPLIPGTRAVTGKDGTVVTTRGLDGCLVIANVLTGDKAVVETICEPRAIALAGQKVLVLDNTGTALWSIDASMDGVPSPTLVASFNVAYSGLVAAPDGSQAAVATVPARPSDLGIWELSPNDLALRRLAVVTLSTGAVESFLTANALRDVDFTTTQVIATMGYHDKFGFPHVVLQVFDRSDLSFQGTVDFPNCADDLQIHPSETLAVLAPRTCGLRSIILEQPEVVETWDEWPEPPEQNADPISFIDLTSLTHLANVPGFGPAAFAPDGLAVAGYTQLESLMVEWNLFQNEDFGMVVASTEDYTFDFFDAGDRRPDFAWDGFGTLYVAGERGGEPFTASWDPASATLVDVDAAALTQRAVAPGGGMYVLGDGALYALKPGAAEVVAEIDGEALSAIGGVLVVTDRSSDRHTVFDAETGVALRVISLR